MPFCAKRMLSAILTYIYPSYTANRSTEINSGAKNRAPAQGMDWVKPANKPKGWFSLPVELQCSLQKNCNSHGEVWSLSKSAWTNLKPFTDSQVWARWLFWLLPEPVICISLPEPEGWNRHKNVTLYILKAGSAARV